VGFLLEVRNGPLGYPIQVDSRYTVHMGLFDDITGFVSDLGSIGGDMSQVKDDVASTLSDTGAEVQQTLGDTATGVTDTFADFRDTIANVTDLGSDNQ
jgi:hypothetical protein